MARDTTVYNVDKTYLNTFWSDSFDQTQDLGWERLLSERERSGDKYSWLHIAVAAEHEDVVEAILRPLLPAAGESPNGDVTRSLLPFNFLHARTREGWTALHLAVVAGNMKILKVLKTAYDSKSVQKPPLTTWDFADCCWMTPLHYAVLQNRQEQIKLLLEWELYYLHVNARDFFQRTPLHMAACHRPVSVEPFVGCPRVDINALDSLMLSPLHWAICFGREEVVKCLVDKLSTVEFVDWDIEGRSIWEHATDNVLVNLIKTAKTATEYDRDFLMFDHRKVSTKIRGLLLMIPAVKAEIDKSEKSLQMYMSATNSIVVVASLIASSSFSQSIQVPDLGQVGKTVYVLCRSTAFYLAIMTLIASFVTYHSLGKAAPGRVHLREIKFALRRITFILAWSIDAFLVAFSIANWAPMKPSHSHASFAVYLCASITGIAWCLLYVMVLPFRRDVKRANDDQQQDFTPDNTRASLVRNLYDKKEHNRFYWPMWQSACERTNAVKAYSTYRLPRTGTVMEDDGEGYSQFLRDVYGIPSADSQADSQAVPPEMFCPPTYCQGLWMWCWDHLKNLWYLMVFFSVPLFPWFWRMTPTKSGVDFQSLIACAMFGGEYAESFRHGRLYSSNPRGDSDRPRSEHHQRAAEFAESFWQQRGVSTETIKEGFERMENKVRRIEDAYEKCSEHLGNNSDRGEKARHFMYFLDRLPRGILYWINIWFFPKPTKTRFFPKFRRKFRRGSCYWCNFWFNEIRVFPRKFPIVTFCQGYALKRDIERFGTISDEILGRKDGQYETVVMFSG